MKENEKKSDFGHQQENQSESDVFGGVYKEVMDVKSKSRLWSVIALILAVVSLSLCVLVYWLALIFGTASIMAIFISRKSLGYFDRITVFSLIMAIFGTIFSLLLLIVSFIIKANPDLVQVFTWI